jgi:hypothetical protein
MIGYYEFGGFAQAEVLCGYLFIDNARASMMYVCQEAGLDLMTAGPEVQKATHRDVSAAARELS